MESRLVKITREEFPIYAEQIIEIENSSFPSPWSINAFKGEVERSISHLWALVTDKSLRAYICFWMFDSEIQLINLAVHPMNRGQRLAQFLLSRMIDTGVSKGLKSIWLEVRPSNMAARKLYDKLGFHEVSRRSRYYTETNEDAIVMALALSWQKPRQGCRAGPLKEKAADFMPH
jgi:ribosomal-protein-alanine N-acetyltransferase